MLHVNREEVVAEEEEELNKLRIEVESN
jgi:hypothetical protein